MATIHAPASRPVGPVILAPVAAALFQILTPVLPSLGIGAPIGSQSDSVSTLVTPAGWAFAIWGPLYLGTLVFAGYQALPANRYDPLLARLRWPAAGAFFGNGLWALYTQSFGLSIVSVAIILFTLGCLLRAYRTLAAWPTRFSAGARWCAVLPLSALTSWLTVASTVNIAAALRFHGVDAGESAPLIAAAVMIVASAIGALALLRSAGNPPYALVFLWALTAIHAAGGSTSAPVALAALAGGALIVVATLIGLVRGGRRKWF
ncbi:hypothetical protein [Sphingomonas sp. Leaf25]|uniref:hypothetical protein n=1 Tax=Sphingomonas sp. Leaf25 TaxID=1735692 RepID=UPI0006FC0F61|nr:hypothetical protein [Sphingomonas sp. Leaf25]KQM97622.1 hypothetical protein ASE78_09605 [Sphingomonas sp. Leaf25]